MIDSTARAERINLLPSSTSPSYTWEVPQKPVSVRIPLELIDRLEQESVESFRSLSSRGSEIGGLLLGGVAPGSPALVSLSDFELIPCDYSRGPLYRLSDADMGRFERSMEQRIVVGGLRVVGYFRSHTRKGLSLDAEDLAFFEARFREPHHVALLIRPFATKASTAGIFIWENGKVRGEASHLEFPFRSALLAPAKAGAEGAGSGAGNAASSVAAAPSTRPPVRAQIVPIAPRREAGTPAPAPPVESAPQDKPAAVAASAAVVPEARSTAPEIARTEEKPVALAKPAELLKPVVPEKALAPEKPSTPVKASPPEKPAEQEKAAAEKPAIEKPVTEKPVPEKPVAEKPATEKSEKAFVAEPPPAPAKPAPDKTAVPEKTVAREKIGEPEKSAAPVKAPAPEKSASAKPPAPVAAPVVEPVVAEAAAPGEALVSKRGVKMMRLLWAAAVTVIAFVVLFVYPGLLHRGARPGPVAAHQDSSPLSLRAEHAGADLMLTWNRDADVVKNATRAVLSISDGERQENYNMDLNQLRIGSIQYTPVTSDVSFRMEVTERNQATTTTEAVRVLGTRPSPMSDQPQAPLPGEKGKPITGPQTAPAETSGGASPQAPTASVPENTPPRTVTPVKPFSTDSLVDRLRPVARTEDLPEAPSLGTRGSSAAPSVVPGLGAVVAPPMAPAPAPPAPSSAAGEKKAAAPGKAGGQIRQAELIFRKEPEYPRLARETGAKGTVELLATIGADGKVKHVRIVAGHPLLTRAAADAVSQWVYRPTLLNGTPVETEQRILIEFRAER